MAYEWLDIHPTVYNACHRSTFNISFRPVLHHVINKATNEELYDHYLKAYRKCFAKHKCKHRDVMASFSVLQLILYLHAAYNSSSFELQATRTLYNFNNNHYQSHQHTEFFSKYHFLPFVKLPNAPATWEHDEQFVDPTKLLFLQRDNAPSTQLEFWFPFQFRRGNIDDYGEFPIYIRVSTYHTGIPYRD
ncbi:hypothetical protein SLS58_010206 [Diplodia intermedia]|uniref:Uncharacterized protein n=1 Tax=Diplodia intermedia TaxID=856260 RepID=A0ABR3T7I9_9PEZI